MTIYQLTVNTGYSWVFTENPAQLIYIGFTVGNPAYLFRREVIDCMLNNIGATELGVLAVVLFFLFGGKKLPELAKGVGESVSELRRVAKEDV